MTSAYIIEHVDVSTFDVTVNVQYDSSCSSSTDFSLLVNVPRGSSILNVLERANENYPTFDGFKVIYLSPSSYYLLSINGEGGSPGPCSWTISTDPASMQSPTKPINEVYASNIGMSVTFYYTDGTTAKLPVPSLPIEVSNEYNT